MATSHTLKAEKRARTGSGKLNQMRAEGLVPAVMYGAGFECVNLKLNAKEFSAVLASSLSEHILVSLEIPELGNKMALVKDVQRNAITGQFLHVDFLQVDANTEIHATIPVVLHGEAAGTKLGGILEQHIHDIEVKCKSKDLPESIEVDVTELGLNEPLTIGDLKLPKGVAPVLGGDVIVVLISASAATLSEETAAAEAAEK